MSCFAGASAAGPARLDADDVMQLARAGRLVALAVLGLARHERAVGQLVEELARLGRVLEQVAGRHAEHLDDLQHLVALWTREAATRFTLNHIIAH